ncbi:MAG: DUF2723 domain-containing protein [Candidatus Eisenbacteria bacterium]|nr:DUF2723 domain-containing protein [Candidatus Eisenbacteria bacterium]
MRDSARSGRLRAPASVAVGLAAAALYAILAPRVAGEGDGNELTVTLALFGVPHPTGYPLYTMLGGAFCSLAHRFGLGWWHAANLWSAVGGGVAIGLLHALAVRLIPGESPSGRGARFAAALVPAGLFAIHPVWLAESTLAEVTSWHLAWVAAAALLCLVLAGRIRAHAKEGSSGAGAAFAWGAVCGLGMAHHVTAVLFILPLSLVLGWEVSRAGGWRPWMLPAALAGAALPIASYAFLLYRAYHPSAFQWPLLEPSLASAWRHVRGGPYGVFVGHFAPPPEQKALLASSVYPLLIAGLPITLVASGMAREAVRSVLLALLGAVLLQGLFVWNYGVADPVTYFLPLLLVALLGLAPVVAWLSERANLAFVPAAVALLAIALPAGPWLKTAVDRSRRLEFVEERIRVAWLSIPFPRAIVLWQTDLYLRLRGYQLLHGERPDYYVENPTMLTWNAPRLAFEGRWGFDPLDGLELRSDADLVLVGDNIQRQTQVPVVDFAQALHLTREMSKPGPVNDAGGNSGGR